MNRREAIAALVGLPAVARITTVPLAPGDVIVVECEDLISAYTAERIRDTLADVWPGHRIVVLDRGLRLKVLEGKS